MEGAIFDRIFELLLAQGLTGLICVVLGYAVYKLYNRNQELNETLFDMGRESVKANEAAASAINRLSDLLVRGRKPE